jgi:hypothetical protein
MMNHYRKFLKVIKSDLFKFFKDAYRSFQIDKTDEYIFRLDFLNFYLYCFDENYKNSLKLLPIKQIIQPTIKYNILKEQNTNTWFFVCDNIIVFHINFNDFEDFYLSFIYSEFKMIFYKTHSHYIIFCVSHKPNEIKDIKSFLLYNNNDIRYTILSFFINNEGPKRLPINEKTEYPAEYPTEYPTEYSKPIIYNNNLKYSGIIPLNIDYKSLRINNIKKYCLTFHSIIGLGVPQKQLVETVNIILEYIKNNTYLPCNYINLY